VSSVGAVSIRGVGGIGGCILRWTGRKMREEVEWWCGEERYRRGCGLLCESWYVTTPTLLGLRTRWTTRSAVADTLKPPGRPFR
jgi:hypothetical protein